MTISFRRLEGCGNVLIVIFDDKFSDSQWKQAAAKLLHPAFGLGSDGLMLVRGKKGNAPQKIVMFNPDGNPSGMCGNGIRCVVRAMVLEGHLPALAQGQASEWIDFLMEDRAISIQYQGDAKQVSVKMGSPAWSPNEIPVDFKSEVINEQIDFDGLPKGLSWSAVNMGNPHVVTIVPTLPSAKELAGWGITVENAKMFPKRTNVEFVKIISRNEIDVAVWERGAGATYACGSGACASAVVTSRLGLTERNCTVRMPGGNLKVELDFHDGSVTLSGPATEIAKGQLESEFMRNCGLKA